MPRGGVEKKNKGKHEVSGRGCVEKFCPVPRGGVKTKTKKSVGHHLCNEFSFRSVPWGGVRMEGDKQTIFKDIVELLGVFSLL